MTILRRLLKEPVVHFVVAGAIFYGILTIFSEPNAGGGELDDTQITVNRDNLLTFMQFRSNAFDAESFALALAEMGDEELEELIDAYIDEEVLYRESVSLNLNESDYIIRQRMVQKMQFLLGDIAGGEAAFTEEELQTYFDENRDVWLVQPSATFTHVFFDSTRRGDEQARLDAQALLTDFNERQVGFNDAAGEGDRFPFLRNYVERTLEYVQGQFGVNFASTLASMDASEQWQGPVRSEYGWHIIMITSRLDARYPDLDEVRTDVERDYIRERSDQLLKDITRSVRDRYEVTVEDIR